MDFCLTDSLCGMDHVRKMRNLCVKVYAHTQIQYVHIHFYKTVYQYDIFNNSKINTT
jgi:hypothetical protein